MCVCVFLCVCVLVCVCVCERDLILDLQNRGVMVENGQNDFVHVLPQTQVDLLLLLQSIDQLKETEKTNAFEGCSHKRTTTSHRSTSGRLTSSLEALSISAAKHWALL